MHLKFIRLNKQASLFSFFPGERSMKVSLKTVQKKIYIILKSELGISGLLIYTTVSNNSLPRHPAMINSISAHNSIKLTSENEL